MLSLNITPTCLFDNWRFSSKLQNAGHPNLEIISNVCLAGLPPPINCISLLASELACFIQPPLGKPLYWLLNKMKKLTAKKNICKGWAGDKKSQTEQTLGIVLKWGCPGSQPQSLGTQKYEQLSSCWYLRNRVVNHWANALPYKFWLVFAVHQRLGFQGLSEKKNWMTWALGEAYLTLQQQVYNIAFTL